MICSKIVHCKIIIVFVLGERKELLWGIVLMYQAPSFFFFFTVLGFELRAYTSSHSTTPFFVKDFFETGSHELFAQAGFET
jgi:hypothetical protein